MLWEAGATDFGVLHFAALFNLQGIIQKPVFTLSIDIASRPIWDETLLSVIC